SSVRTFNVIGLLLRRLLLDPDCLTLAPAARARVRARALAAHRHTFTMPQPAVAGNIHEALDVQLDLAAQVALDAILAVDHFADASNLFLGQVAHPCIRVDIRLFEDVHTI